MSLTVSNAIIIALGGVAYGIAQEFQQQIENRHSGIPMPTVQVLPFLEEDMHQASERPLPSLGVALRQNDNELVDLVKQLFPDSTFPQHPLELARTLNNFPRPRGQVALFQHIYAIQDRLQEVRRQIFSTSAVDLLSQHDVTVADERRVQVFVLASLADSFMTGFLPDLPYVIQHVLKEGAPEDTFVNVHLVLTLPGFKGDVREREEARLSRDYIRLRTQAQTDISANAAACLREVDYYLSDSRRYHREFSEFLEIDTRHNPLGEGRIYVLEPTNEKEKALDDIQALTAMVGNWLYHAVLTPLRQLYDTPVIRQGGKVYSSFGHSSLSVPISRWIERVTIRQQIDVLNTILSVTDIEHSIDIRTARSQLHLTKEDIMEKLREGTDFADLRLQTMAFRHVPLAWAAQFLSRIQARYTEMMGERLPDIRGDIHYRKRQLSSKQTDLGENLLDPLEEYVLELMDEPHAGIIRAHVFLEALRNDLQQERDEIKEASAKRFQDGKNMTRRVDTSRQTYYGRAEVAAGIGSIPFVNLFGMMLLGLLPMSTLLVSFYQQQVPFITWVVMGALLIVTVLMMGRMYNTLQASRYRVIKSYDERLQSFRDADMLAVTAQLYDELINWTGNIRGGVNTIWENLTDIRTQLNGEWDKVSDPEALCGLSPDRMSEYLLTPEAIHQVEQRAKIEDPRTLREALRQEIGTPSQWIKALVSQQELSSRLTEFCRRRVGRELQRYDLKEALRRIEEKPLMNKFNRVLLLSFPYWRHDPTKSDLSESPWQVVAVADTDIDVTRLFGSAYQLFDIQNRYELVVASVRHGFSLSEVNNFTQLLSRSYEYAVSREREMLHTTADRLALPDPSNPRPAEVMLRTLPLRQLYALGRALDVIHMGELGDSGKDISWGNKNGQEVPLGHSPLDTVIQLEQDGDLQKKVRDAVTTAWRKKNSLDRVKQWVAGIDSRQPEHWARLAAEDFIFAADEE